MAFSPSRADFRLQPPRRGDNLALLSCVVGLALYAVVTIILWRNKLIVPESNLLYGLAVGSIALTLLGFALSLGVDVRRLWRDERAIQFLLQVDEGKDPLSEFVARAPSLGGRTLAGDLARRVDQARPGGRAPTPAELRGIAAAHTAQLGGVARFSSQLLLLLTVLGTFLGVREALPELVTTLGATTGPGALGAQTLTRALSAVGDAFGSNLGALLGSIALGIVAYGLGAGRQAMLARLELASVQHVYPALERKAATDGGSEMVRQLREATQSLASLAGLTDAMKDLKDEVAQSSDRTARLLERALKQEREVTLKDTRQQVSTLEGLVTDVVTTVQANATEYATIAQALASRDRDFGTAVSEIREVAEALHRVSDSHGENVRGMARDILAALAQTQITVGEAVTVSSGIRDDLRAARDDAQTLIGGVAALATALAAAEAAATRARQEAAERERVALAALREQQSAALAAGDRHQRETLDRVEAELVQLLAERITPSVGELRGSVDSLRGAVERVPAGTELGVLEAFRRARAERTGGGVDDLTSVLERVSVLIERLDLPAGQLSTALRQLAQRIDALEPRREQPFWRRWMRRPAPGSSPSAYRSEPPLTSRQADRAWPPAEGQAGYAAGEAYARPSRDPRDFAEPPTARVPMRAPTSAPEEFRTIDSIAASAEPLGLPHDMADGAAAGPSSEASGEPVDWRARSSADRSMAATSPTLVEWMEAAEMVDLSPPAESRESAQLAEPAELNEWAESAQPAEPARSSEPVESAHSDESPEPVQSNQPAQSTDSIESTHTAEAESAMDRPGAAAPVSGNDESSPVLPVDGRARGSGTPEPGRAPPAGGDESGPADAPHLVIEPHDSPTMAEPAGSAEMRDADEPSPGHPADPVGPEADPGASLELPQAPGGMDELAPQAPPAEAAGDSEAAARDGSDAGDGTPAGVEEER
ncbi:MAG TPA: hypothetical protein VFJ16_28095 [Longimicrobium sp.]|nr:hypothetical protein [Longimicrobium sp.]